ncbi:MAG: hypothetical protein L6R19_10255 [Alphaproteobacteria bacterium]|nr:hypothetical protein [Alphaproteobacteria bacterium]
MPGGGQAGRLVLLAAGALTLAGCFSGTSEKMGAVKATSVATPVAMAALAAHENPYADGGSALPALPKRPDPPRESAASGIQVAALPAPAPAQNGIAALPPGEGLKRLIGLDRAALESMLGAPWLLKREAAAELWQYRAPDCVLDLFLYARNGELRVAHADLRARRENRPVPAGCFAELVGGTSQKAELVKG